MLVVLAHLVMNYAQAADETPGVVIIRVIDSSGIKRPYTLSGVVNIKPRGRPGPHQAVERGQDWHVTLSPGSYEISLTPRAGLDRTSLCFDNKVSVVVHVFPSSRRLRVIAASRYCHPDYDTSAGLTVQVGKAPSLSGAPWCALHGVGQDHPGEYADLNEKRKCIFQAQAQGAYLFSVFDARGFVKTVPIVVMHHAREIRVDIDGN